MVDRLECDLIVIGAGMAGMSAASRAANAGARVVVIEKAAEIGGSAALSGGYLWTATSTAQMRRHDDGDPALHAVVIEEYPAVLEALRRRGIDMGPPQPVLYGRGTQIDMQAHLRKAVAEVEEAGGHVVRSTKTREILHDSGRIAGIVTSHPDGNAELIAPKVLIATGGFQGDPDMRARHIHPAASGMALRSNSVSVGDGLRLGIAAGGAMAGPNSGFYGHLVAHPLTLRTDADFVKFTQYHSIHCALLNREGKRFVDESHDDHASTQIALRQSGATVLCIWDSRVQRDFATGAPVAGAAPMDRFEIAIQAGAHGGSFDTLEGLARFADGLGFDGNACAATLKDFNLQVGRAPEAMIPPREGNYRAIGEPPYYVLEVAAAITFTFAGLRVDSAARALDPFGAPVEGLYVAGADVGNVYRRGYAGGLALASTFAFRAMASAGF